VRTGKGMTQKEGRFEQLKQHIVALKKSTSRSWTLLFIGALITTGAVVASEILWGLLGFLIIIFVLI
jgi:hypothetical protein